MGKYIITAEELGDTLEQYLVIDLREAQEYTKGHLRGAMPIPVDPLLNDENTNLLPAWRFAAIMSSLGATTDTRVVVYDDNLGRASCRFLYAARHYGHKDIRMLDGGVKSIVGMPLEAGGREPAFSYYYPGYEPGYFYFLGDLLKNYDNVRILDTRSRAEYDGAMPMNNPRGGHLPGALHLSHDQLLDIEGMGTFIEPELVEEKVYKLGLGKEDTIVIYCQSGVRAAVAGLAMRNAGFLNTIVYDGSMFEWTRCAGLKLDNEVLAKA